MSESQTYKLRDLDQGNEAEFDRIVEFCLETIRETLPEIRENPESLPNNDFPSMKSMLRLSFGNPEKRFVVIEDENGNIVGHSIFKIDSNDTGERFGYLFTRYVLPEHRKKGLGSKLLEEALQWFDKVGMDRVDAATHINNLPLQGLLQKYGFKIVEQKQGRWPFYVLSKKKDNGHLYSKS